MSTIMKDNTINKYIIKDLFRDDVIQKHTSIDAKFILLEESLINDIINTENVMGMVEFKHGNDTRTLSMIIPDFIPIIEVHMDPRQADITDRSFIEVWFSDNKVTYGSSNGFKYGVDGETMFACSELINYKSSLEEASEKKYDELFDLILSHQYPYLYRMWNFVFDINEEKPNQLERYKSFCLGRANSFFKNYLKTEDFKFPAATGIGSLSGDISIYFIASTLPRHIHLENPRQLSAFKYPKKYGPQSPSFARATYYDRGDTTCDIYVSGTASILGHDTVFTDDIVKQCDTTLSNIEYLISCENLANYDLNYNPTLKDLKVIKVYIRHLKDFDYIIKRCTEAFDTDDIIYLQADVCRSDLILEIEGFVTVTATKI